MGIRGEIFSTRVVLDNRTYFFNVKENRTGDLYLNIVESKNREGSGFERQSIVIFADDAQVFLRGFDESLKILEKSVREKQKSRRERPEKCDFRGSVGKNEYPDHQKRYESGKNERQERENRPETGKKFVKIRKNGRENAKIGENPRKRRVVTAHRTQKDDRVRTPDKP